MSYKVNKIIYLLLGLVLGFFVGGGIIWWQLQKNDLFDFLGFRKNEVRIDTNQYDKSIRPDKKNKTKFHVGNVNIPATFIDSLKKDTAKLSIEELIALYNNEKFERKDTSSQSGSSYDDIVVSKDELIITRLIKISGDIPERNDDYELDSILTDQRNTKRKSNKVIKVEFWKSPLNYKGFKFDENKLVIFGLYEFNNVSIIGYNNDLYIKYNKDYYPIDFTDDFRSFLPLRNDVLIKELNSK